MNCKKNDFACILATTELKSDAAVDGVGAWWRRSCFQAVKDSDVTWRQFTRPESRRSRVDRTSNSRGGRRRKASPR